MVTRVLQDTALRSLSWSLHEPEGDFFTGLGITLLDEQLRDIARIGADAQAEKYGRAPGAGAG